MPIVIRELVIRARVEENDHPSRNNGPNSMDMKSQKISEMEIERIVAICIEKTMAVINRKTER